MKYFFVPGRISDLAVAELKALTAGYFNNFSIEQVSENLFLVDTNLSEQEMVRLFNRLGAYVKFGRIIDLDTVLDDFSERNKVVFGVSVEEDLAGNWNAKRIKELSEQIKAGLKERGVSARYILPRQLSLNAGQIIKNKLLDKGFELVLFNTKKGSYYGVTIEVQDVDLFSLIDYGKPQTNKKMGVLPVKLARVLVNLTGLKEGKTIWDPFCGSGTIPLTALISGLNVVASDIDSQAVEDTNNNIAWLGEQGVVGNVKYNTFVMDITKPEGKLLKDLRNTDIDGIVCEPFMGPPQYKPLSPAKANELLQMVSDLYTSLFEVLKETKKRNVAVVLIVPSFKTRKGWVTTSINSVAGKEWEIENKKLLKGGDLHWERPNSIIRRNIFILSKRK